MNRFDWMSRWADYSPDKVAIKEIDGNRQITYRQLNNAANRLAARLTGEMGLKKGDRVAILAENGLPQFVLFSAAQKTGLILVPLNFRLTAREIGGLLDDCRPALIVVEAKFTNLIDCNTPGAKQQCWHYESLRQFCETAADQPFRFLSPTELREDDPVFILYTSGTTGFPKGALYTHRMLFWNSVNTALRLNLTADDRTVTCLPLFHTGGWNVLSTPFLHHGAYFCLTRKFDPAEVLHLLDSEQLTLFMGVPTMLKLMAADPGFAAARLDSLRYFIVGGEAMPLPLIETWHRKGVPIRQGYGLTEVGPNITSLHQDDTIRKIGSIGMPNFYVDIRIVDDTGQEADVNQPGELQLKGPMTTPGYWENPEATADSLQDGWFSTGDVVRQDPDGFLYVVDRKKNMFISGGENVYPVEVEKFLHTHTDILDVAVIGVPDEKWGETGKAFIVLRPGSALSAEEVWEFCKGKLAKFKIPGHIEFIDELPKGDTGKIDRQKLKGA